MILLDTSAWVEYLRHTDSDVNGRVHEAIERDEELPVLDVVRLELLAGAGGEPQADALRRFLARFPPVPTASPADHEHAAALYRSARRSGRTVRSLVDCLVAAAALRLDLPLLARDRDYPALAAVCDLRLL